MVTQSRSMINENFISTDAGNGYAACYRLVNGKVKHHGIPHARARVTGAKMSADLGSQNIAEYADFLGQRYGYGDDIWNLTDAPIDTHQNSERRYGGNMHIFLILVNIAAMGVKSGSELSLIVPAPPGLLNQVGKTIKENLRAGERGDGSGEWSIQLRNDKKPRTYIIKRVIVMPEGAGAYAAFRVNLEGESVPLPDANGADMLSGRVAVLDLGAGTGDNYVIYDGNLNPESIAHATDARAGVIHNLQQPILGDIMTAVPSAQHLTTSHVDALLRRYVSATTDEDRQAAAVLRVSGKSINVEESILYNCNRYAEWIAANKIDALWGAGTDAIIMAGGGWLYISSFIREMYPDRLILSPDMFKHTRSIALYDLNGYGQLAFSAAAMRAQQV